MSRRSMRSAVFVAPGEIQIEKRPLPAPAAGEALVQVEFVAICGSDQARFWDTGEDFGEPVVLGHEFSGRIVSLVGGKGLAPGQCVTVAPLFNCGECEFCRAGKENLCPNRRRFGVSTDGALQEYVCVPAGRIYQLPVHISLEEGALIEPLAVAHHAVRQAGAPRGEAALVLGAGAIGLLIAQVWRASGYGYIAVVDVDAKRLAVAERLGIPVYREAPAGSCFHTIFEATGSTAAFSKWLPALTPQGNVVVVSKLEGAATIDWLNLMRKEAGIVTSRYFTLDDFERSIELVEKGKIQLKPLIGRIVSMGQLGEDHGVGVMSQAREVVRLLVCIVEQVEAVNG